MHIANSQASILYKSIAGHYQPISYPDGPITASYRFIKNAYWVLNEPAHTWSDQSLCSLPGESLTAVVSPC